MKGKIKLIFIGKDKAGDHKYCDMSLKQSFYFKKALFPGRPGTIYKLEYTQDEKGLAVKTQSMEYHGFFKDDKQVAEWQIKHDANNQEIKIKNKIKRESNKNRWKEYLKPVHQAYKYAPDKDKPLIISMAIQMIINGK